MLMRMREEYIKWTKTGRKTATSRLKQKKLGGIYELASGSFYKTKKSGVKVKIYAIKEWSQDKIDDIDKELIYKSEGFSSWKKFISVLKEINKNKLQNNTKIYTMFYEKIN